MSLPKEEEVFVKVKANYKLAYDAADNYRKRILRYRNIYRDDPIASGSAMKFKSYAIKKAMKKIIPQASESILSNNRLFSVASNDETSRHADILNYQWNNTLEKNKVVASYLNYFFIDGTGILKTEWEIVTKEEKVSTPLVGKSTVKSKVIAFAQTLSPDRSSKLISLFNRTGSAPIVTGTKEETVKEVLSNAPRLRSIDPMRILVSPKATLETGSDYIIEEMEVSYADVLLNPDLYKNGGKVFLDKVKGSNGTYSDAEYNYWSSEDADISGDNGKSLFNIVANNEDIANMKVTLKEYWGTHITNGSRIPYVISWIDDTVVRYSENPYPHGEPPYSFAQCNPSNDSMFGEADAETLGQDQTSLNKILSILDKASEKFADDQEFIEYGFLPDITQEQNYKNGKTVFYRKGSDPRTAIFKNSIEKIPDTAEYLASRYETSINNELYYSPAGADQNGDVSDSFIDSEMSKLRSALSAISSAGSQIASMNKSYLVFGQKMPKTDIDAEIQVSPEMLAGEFSKVMAIAHTKRYNNLMANNIMNLISSSPVEMPEPIIAAQYAEVARLWGRDSLARTIIEESRREKEPDPMQQLEMKRLELELEKVKAETVRENARAEELIAQAVERYFNIEQNVAGSIASKNRATEVMSNAHSEKLKAQTELFNQEFGMISSGEKEQRENLKLEYAHGANLEREKIRTDRELELNNKSHEQAMAQKAQESNSEPKEKSNPLLDYIRRGTVENDSYDAMDDVYRNIREKNSLDTTQYTGKDKNTKDI